MNVATLPLNRVGNPKKTSVPLGFTSACYLDIHQCAYFSYAEDLISLFVLSIDKKWTYSFNSSNASQHESFYEKWSKREDILPN